MAKNYSRFGENDIINLVAAYSFIAAHDMNKQIARITLKNIRRIPEMNTEEIARECGVSPSTFLRFCKDIGYPSFTEFKMRIANSLKMYQSTGAASFKKDDISEEDFVGRYREIMNHDIDQFEKLFDFHTCQKVIDAFYQARSVVFVEILYSFNRFPLHTDLAFTGKDVEFLQPSEETVRYLSQTLSRDSLVFLTLGETYPVESMAEAIPLWKAKKAHITVLSSMSHFKYDDQCDEILITGVGSTPVAAVTVHDMALHYLSLLYRKTYIR